MVSEATAYRVLRTLVQANYARPASTRGGYVATLSIVELAAKVIDRTEVRDIARPVLQRVAHTYEESVTLAVPDRDHVVFVDRIPVRTSVAFFCDTGRRLPLHVGAASRCVLAHLPETLFDDYIRRPLTGSTGHTKVTPEDLREDRKLVLQTGYAISIDDVEVGISAVGIPICNSYGEVLAAAAIANLTARWSESDRRDRAKAMLEVAADISNECGFLKPRPIGWVGYDAF